MEVVGSNPAAAGSSRIAQSGRAPGAGGQSDQLVARSTLRTPQMPLDQSDDAVAEYWRWYHRHYMRAWRRGQAVKAEAERAAAMKDPVEHARHAARARWAHKRKLKPRKQPTLLALI